MLISRSKLAFLIDQDLPLPTQYLSEILTATLRTYVRWGSTIKKIRVTVPRSPPQRGFLDLEWNGLGSIQQTQVLKRLGRKLPTVASSTVFKVTGRYPWWLTWLGPGEPRWFSLYELVQLYLRLTSTRH